MRTAWLIENPKLPLWLGCDGSHWYWSSAAEALHYETEPKAKEALRRLAGVGIDPDGLVVTEHMFDEGVP